MQTLYVWTSDNPGFPSGGLITRTQQLIVHFTEEILSSSTDEQKLFHMDFLLMDSWKTESGYNRYQNRMYNIQDSAVQFQIQ